MQHENPENSVALRPLVNGASLIKYIGRSVTLIGEVILVNNQGISFDVKTPDSQIVTVSLRKPLTESISGVVEVHGIVKGKANLICDFYVIYPKELAHSYDKGLINETIQVIQNIPTPWTPSVRT